MSLTLLLAALLTSPASAKAASTQEPSTGAESSRNDPSRMTLDISRTRRGRLKTWCLAVVVTVCDTLGPQSEESDSPKPPDATPELAALRAPEVFGKAKVLERAGDLAEAKRYYQHYLKLDPKGPHAKDCKRGLARINPHLEMRVYDPRPEKAAREVEAGDYYVETKNFTSAMNHYLHALEIHPDNDVALFRMAGVLETVGQLSEAREYYAVYLKNHPQGEFAGACKRALVRLPEAAPPTSAPAETLPSKRSPQS